MALADVIKAAEQRYLEQEQNTKNTTEKQTCSAETPVVTGENTKNTKNTKNTTKTTEVNLPRESVVARYRDNAEWCKARDKWHRHYYRCTACQRLHRTTKHRPLNNPCLTGDRLYQKYLTTC